MVSYSALTFEDVGSNVKDATVTAVPRKTEKDIYILTLYIYLNQNHITCTYLLTIYNYLVFFL